MKFTRIGQWAEMSDCKRYTVAASKVGDAFKFQAWRIVPGAVAQLLGTEDQAEAARGLCRADSPTASTADLHAKTRADTAEQGEVVRTW